MLASRLCLFDWRPVPSRLLFVVAVALFGLVSSCVSCGGVFGVGSLERSGMAVRGCWMWAGGVPWAWWWCHPHVSSFFFLPLVSDEAVERLRLLRLVPRFVSPSRSSVSYRRLVYSVLVCVSSGRLAFCLVSVSL